MTPCSPSIPPIPPISIFNLQWGEIEVCFCHILKILTIGSTHLNKINGEAIVKTSPLNPIWQKTRLAEVAEMLVRSPKLQYISNSVIGRICDQDSKSLNTTVAYLE